MKKFKTKSSYSLLLTHAAKLFVTKLSKMSFQSLTFTHLGSIYLLNITVLRNVEEAEKIGISHSNPIHVLILVRKIANSEMGRE